MSSSKTSFLELIGEIRNQIYECHLKDADKPTVRISSTGFRPPALARTNRQVRAEFMSYWSSMTHDLLETKHVKARVINLDFDFLMEFFNKATEDLAREPLFKRISITFVLTEDWKHVPSAEKRRRLRKWLLWLDEPGLLLVNGAIKYTAKFEREFLGVADARLMFADLGVAAAGEEHLRSMRTAVRFAGGW